MIVSRILKAKVFNKKKVAETFFLRALSSGAKYVIGVPRHFNPFRQDLIIGLLEAWYFCKMVAQNMLSTYEVK